MNNDNNNDSKNRNGGSGYNNNGGGGNGNRNNNDNNNGNNNDIRNHSDGRNTKDDGNSDNNNGMKSACEDLDHNVFDCASRKQIEACNETLKEMVIHVTTSMDFGKNSGNVKCAIEHLEDPDLEEQDLMTDNEQRDRLKWFIWTETTK